MLANSSRSVVPTLGVEKIMAKLAPKRPRLITFAKLKNIWRTTGATSLKPRVSRKASN